MLRHHVGLALAAAGDPAASPGVTLSWRQRRPVDSAIRRLERPLEEAVSYWLSSLSLLWVEVPDAPGPESERALVKKGTVALLSRHAHLDPPSRSWLGRHAESEEIRSSGLWNVRHVGAPVDDSFLDVLERRVESR